MFDKTLEEQHAAVGDVIALKMPGSGRLRVARITEDLRSKNGKVFIVRSLRRDGSDGPEWAVLGRAHAGWEVRTESAADLLGIPKGLLTISGPPMLPSDIEKLRSEFRAATEKSEFKSPTFGCEHEWVDIGFRHLKIICKKCDKEKV